ncbi:hypothetical protein FA15DRAFT_707641 [Coprinopsis marcescibilis]|uniref:Uncharacterized protein n=1 Tax=Coprinopsis marcescibilis TaxID=230819 RepID=A0A5C3KLW2_COPMA|nr:hypothetical protein FA15DRAFT_707641 [Coprinopsis marcescibilis]
MILLEGNPDEKNQLEFEAAVVSRSSWSSLRPPQPATIRLRLPEEYASSVRSSLPDYETSQRVHRKPPQLAQNWTVFGVSRRKVSTWALIALVVLVLAVILPVSIVRSRRDDQGRQTFEEFGVSESISSPYTISQLQWEGYAGECIEPTTSNSRFYTDSTGYYVESILTQYRLQATGLVAIRLDSTYLSQLVGSLTVEMSKDLDQQDAIMNVGITASPNILGAVTVCLNQANSTRGLTPQAYGVNDTLAVDIRVELPQTSSIEAFVTNLPGFAQTIGTVHGIETLYLEGYNASISCEFAKASFVTISNALAPIRGTFYVGKSIELKGIHSLVEVNVTLEYSPAPLGDSVEPWTVLDINGAHSPIIANVTLYKPQIVQSIDNSTEVSVSGNPFFTSVVSYAGLIDLALSQPSDYPPGVTGQTLNVRNSLAATVVKLDSKIADTFTVRSRLDGVRLQVHGNDTTSLTHPEGLTRLVHLDKQTARKIIGRVEWQGLSESLEPVFSHTDILSSSGSVLLEFT